MHNKYDTLDWSELYIAIDDAIYNFEIPPPPNGKDYVGNWPIFAFIQVLKGIEPSLIEILSSEYIKNNIVWPFWENYQELLLDDDGNNLNFIEVWAAFWEAWPKVKYPKRNIMETAIMRATQRNEPLPEAETYGDDDKVQILVAVCFELQILQGMEPFWLSYDTAANILHKSPVHAGRILKLLVHDGILKVVAEHTNHSATRYKYIGESINIVRH